MATVDWTDLLSTMQKTHQEQLAAEAATRLPSSSDDDMDEDEQEQEEDIFDDETMFYMNSYGTSEEEQKQILHGTQRHQVNNNGHSLPTSVMSDQEKIISDQARELSFFANERKRKLDGSSSSTMGGMYGSSRLDESRLGGFADAARATRSALRDARMPDAVPWPEGLERYKNGALRMTKTPGRERLGTPNCINANDVLKPASIVKMFESTFYLAIPEHLPHLPVFSQVTSSSLHALRAPPIYIAHHLRNDFMAPAAAQRVGVPDAASVEKHSKIAKELANYYSGLLGEHVHMLYPTITSGSSHSKVMAIEYPDGKGSTFLLVVITSANAMDGDMRYSDNHWFVQSFPRTQKRQKSDFETRLLSHLDELGADEFTSTIRGRYDFSRANGVHLFSTTPGIKKDAQLEQFGILRLASLVRQLIPNDLDRRKLVLEITTASPGVLSNKSVKQSNHFLRGGDTDQSCVPFGQSSKHMPDSATFKLIFPTQVHGDSCSEIVRKYSSNMSLHTRWESVSPELRQLFHSFESKDTGSLMHLKTIVWYPPSTSSSSTPLLIALGSANFSQNALGVIGYLASGQPKLESHTNFELGVVIEGKRIKELVEPGTTWEDVIPWERPAKRYGAEDRPYSPGVWGKKKNGD